MTLDLFVTFLGCAGALVAVGLTLWMEERRRAARTRYDAEEAARLWHESHAIVRQHRRETERMRELIREYQSDHRRSLVLDGFDASPTPIHQESDPDAPRVVHLVVPDAVSEDDYRLALAVLRGDDQVAVRALADKVREA